MKKCDFLKTLQWPDFETLWGNQGHNDVKHGINGSSGTFFLWGVVKACSDTVIVLKLSQ